MAEKKKGASGRSYRGTGGLATRPHKGHRRASSRRWIERQLNDPFVAEAKARGFRARSALKLEQIDCKYGLLRQGMAVLDLGCAPGGWLQYTAARIGRGGRLIGVDLLPTGPLAGAEIIEGDINDAAIMEKIMVALGEGGGACDLVLSDMAADTTGHRATDHLRTTALLEIALATARECLAPGGGFLAKCFRGGAEAESLALMRREFASVRHAKPAASRKESVETYVLAQGFRGGGRVSAGIRK